MLRRLELVRTDVSEELSASFIRVTRIGELGKTQAVTCNRRVLHSSKCSASPLFQFYCLSLPPTQREVSVRYPPPESEFSAAETPLRRVGGSCRRGPGREHGSSGLWRKQSGAIDPIRAAVSCSELP
jgi:hypothetical protein